jgi:UV DNA damage endonuclease
MHHDSVKRIGFPCKYLHPDQSQPRRVQEESQAPFNIKTTTVAWLNRQTRTVAEQRLWDIMIHNIQATQRLVTYVSELPAGLRMLRLGSDILPVYSEPTWCYFWRRTDVIDAVSRGFAEIGALARHHGVRLSFHPGPYVVLASHNPDIVDRSIKEFEYHADMARWMGYGAVFQDLKINVHISGRAGPAGIIQALRRLSPEARNTITIENDEMCWGLDASMELMDHCALVLDIHHHWIRTGEYIEACDDRISGIIHSWRGVRPVIHYSVSREEMLTDHCVHTRPDLQTLLCAGHRKTKLRAHSDLYWNHAVNQWALSHLEWADIMTEARHKNIASFALYEHHVHTQKEGTVCPL